MQFVECLRLDRKPFHLVGTSMGGNVAGVYAATYPADVCSITLISPAGQLLCHSVKCLTTFLSLTYPTVGAGSSQLVNCPPDCVSLQALSTRVRPSLTTTFRTLRTATTPWTSPSYPPPPRRWGTCSSSALMSDSKSPSRWSLFVSYWTQDQSKNKPKVGPSNEKKPEYWCVLIGFVLMWNYFLLHIKIRNVFSICIRSSKDWWMWELLTMIFIKKVSIICLL